LIGQTPLQLGDVRSTTASPHEPASRRDVHGYAPSGGRCPCCPWTGAARCTFADHGLRWPQVENRQHGTDRPGLLGKRARIWSYVARHPYERDLGRLREDLEGGEAQAKALRRQGNGGGLGTGSELFAFTLPLDSPAGPVDEQAFYGPVASSPLERRRYRRD
jgi:hypothetical protein